MLRDALTFNNEAVEKTHGLKIGKEEQESEVFNICLQNIESPMQRALRSIHHSQEVQQDEDGRVPARFHRQEEGW